MYTVDYTKALKWLVDTNSSLPGEGKLDQEYFTPLDHPHKKPAPHHCQAIRIFCLRDRPSEKQTQDHFFKTVTLPREHLIFTSGRSLISPLSKAIGIPLIVYLEAPLGHPLMHSKRDLRNYENQAVTSLLIKLRTGHPSFEHYHGLGTALVARLDYQPLSIGLLTAINAYETILEKERYNPDGDTGNIQVQYGVQYTITPNDFTEFSHAFIDRTKRNFHSEWDIEL